MPTVPFEIRNRWTGEVQVTAQIECEPDTLPSVKLGLAVRWARANGADLRGAVLRGAVLSGADLSGAVLRDADLSGAVLSDADLSGAVL
ncbi:pentapeptide repeat-containing protein, partial [Methylobacterium isbiliense]|uniref:pentapeptide repeat-containing protein n=1 Tax=Methylobacterium isbiliense TaxID=315478 RepID=UPI001EE10B69